MATNRPSSFRPVSSTKKPHISEKARQRPVRVLPSDDRAEMEAGHLIGSGNPYSSNMARPDSETRDGYGPAAGFSDSRSAEAETEDTGNDASGGGFRDLADASSTATDDLR